MQQFPYKLVGAYEILYSFFKFQSLVSEPSKVVKP